MRPLQLLASRISRRHLHTTPVRAFPRKPKALKPLQELDVFEDEVGDAAGSIRGTGAGPEMKDIADYEVMEMEPLPVLAKTGLLLDKEEDEEIEGAPGDKAKEERDRSPTIAAHLYLEQQRQALKYIRLIEHDMPKLVQWRKPFQPPTPDLPLIVRTIDYGGEKHPATAKRVVVVPVALLPLGSPAAVHNFKLLAGPRWTQLPPTDAGVGPNEAGSEHGYVKISCEDYPQPGMNLKWISDVLDRLVVEAQKAGDSFSDVPVDTRHIDARIRKAKKGDHLGRPRPTLKDFPRDWLPQPTTSSESAAPSS